MNNQNDNKNIQENSEVLNIANIISCFLKEVAKTYKN
jgi:hypothetical protein